MIIQIIYVKNGSLDTLITHNKSDAGKAVAGFDDERFIGALSIGDDMHQRDITDEIKEWGTFISHL